jgi:DNA-binding HxlR family transcriptional regulator
VKNNDKKILPRVKPRQIGRMVETVISCKWSLTVLDLVVRGIARPGEMERSIEGLSAKVLNNCLRRLVEFNVLEKRSYAEIPPRVEYRFTTFGMKFRKMLEALDALEVDFEATAAARRVERSATASIARIASADDESAAQRYAADGAPHRR